MLLLGLKMLGLIARLPRLSSLVPAPLRRVFGAASASIAQRGPLQTMQLYALGTGSALAGALSMLVFASGTVPLLLAFGLAATMLPRRFLPAMVRASAVLVMVLGIATFARAAAIAGIALPQLPSLASAGGRTGTAIAGIGAAPRGSAAAVPAGVISPNAPLKAKIENGVQTLTTVFGFNGYVPFVVQANLPLKWIIRIDERDLTSCNSTIIIPGYGIQKTLQGGDNLIEFTPKAAGVVPYSCGMGMLHGYVKAIDDLSKTDLRAIKLEIQNYRASGGGSCCGG